MADYTIQELHFMACAQAANELGDMVTLYRNVVERGGSRADIESARRFLFEAHETWFLMACVVADQHESEKSDAIG